MSGELCLSSCQTMAVNSKAVRQLLKSFPYHGQANMDVYDSKRKAAWKNIQEILGISD